MNYKRNKIIIIITMLQILIIKFKFDENINENYENEKYFKHFVVIKINTILKRKNTVFEYLFIIYSIYIFT